MKNLLLLIDMQNDFIERGALEVSGGYKACEYMADWIVDNINNIDSIIATRDDHYPTHICFSSAWKEDIKPFTKISAKDVQAGKYTPKYMCKEDMINYLRIIEQEGYEHTIWPLHCLHGSEGQQFPKVLLKTLNKWTQYTGKHWKTLDKGQIDETEQYSAFSCADKLYNDPIYNPIEELKNYDKIYIAGIAKDICVYHTLKDIMNYPNITNKLIILEKGMASINPNDRKSNDLYEKALSIGCKVIK